MWSVPYVIMFGIILSNPFTDWLFYYDKNLVYHRGSLVSLFYAFAVYYTVFSIIILIRHRKLVPLSKWIATLTMFPLNIIAVLIQLKYMDLLVENFFMALAIMLLTITVQRPEEILDPQVGCQNFSSFSYEISTGMKTRRRNIIYFVKILNYDSLVIQLGQNGINKVNSQVADYLKNFFDKTNINYMVFYLYSGLFSVLLEEKTKVKFKDYSSEIDDGMAMFLNIDNNLAYLERAISMGVIPEDLTTYDEVMSFSNYFGMYFAKHFEAKKTVYSCKEISANPEFILQNNINEIVKRGFVNNNFSVVYQPVYDVLLNKFVAGEALLRLNDVELGVISDDALIAACEKTGVIHQVGDFVMETVCKYIAGLDFRSLNLKNISINLSLSQILKKDIAAKFNRFLYDNKILPQQISIDITEKIAVSEIELISENINALSNMGFTFALDDFGSGNSNINRIFSLPLQTVKLDKNFVDSLEKEQTKSLLKDVITVFKKQGKKILIEGVETEKQAKETIALGVDYIQGFFYSKPLSDSEFVTFIKRHNA
jgi:EAL domain-containing protein (putative c-di-GMP-specific phosphodiesterase class I)